MAAKQGDTDEPDSGHVPTRRLATFLLVTFGITGAIGLGIFIGRNMTLSSAQAAYGWTFATFVFGALVGLSEILSRYRDEPLLATATMSGMSYLAINGTISAIAFGILRKYPDQIFSGLKNDLLMSAVVAGFGAMVIFRSKLFTFKSSDGKEYPIGPSIVLDTILKMIDSKIDRRRATERQTRVFSKMFGINDFSKTADYIEASLLSFQNLSQDDKTQIISVITEYRTLTKWPDSLKSLALGFAFLTIAGEDNFDLVISNVRTYLKSQQPLPSNPSPGGTPSPAGGAPPPQAPSPIARPPAPVRPDLSPRSKPSVAPQPATGLGPAPGPPQSSAGSKETAAPQQAVGPQQLPGPQPAKVVSMGQESPPNLTPPLVENTKDSRASAEEKRPPS